LPSAAKGHLKNINILERSHKEMKRSGAALGWSASFPTWSAA